MKNSPKQKNLGFKSDRGEGSYFIKKSCYKSYILNSTLFGIKNEQKC